MDKIRYGIIGFGTQGSSYCNMAAKRKTPFCPPGRSQPFFK